mgnify:CR=1 FL=1
MVQEIQELIQSAPDFLGMLITILLIVWAVTWIFLPFFVWGIYEKSKEINQKFEKIISGN